MPCSCKPPYRTHRGGKGNFVVCPNCGQRLEIKDTLKLSHKEGTYFAILDTVDGLQVERVFLLSANFKKGESVSITHNEVCRLWLNAKGQTALTSKAKSMGYYRDCFNWGSDIELRNMTDVHHIIANTWHYPKYPEQDTNLYPGYIRISIRVSVDTPQLSQSNCCFTFLGS